MRISKEIALSLTISTILLFAVGCSGTSNETLANANKKTAAAGGTGSGGTTTGGGTTTPGVAPTISAATLYDCDGDGNIDEVVIQFSASVKDSSIADSDAARFKLGTTSFIKVDSTTGGSGTPTTSTTCPASKDPGAANDAFITLFTNDITETGTQKKAISYTTASGRVTESGGTALATATIAASSSVISDKAFPVIKQATTETGGTPFIVNFSEPVYTVASGCTTATLTQAMFTYTNTSGAGAASLTGISEADASDSVITLTVNTNFVSGDVFVDKISAASAATLCDASSNNMAVANTTVTGVVRPYVLSVVSLTANSIRVTYSEPVDSSSTGGATSATNTTNYCIDTDGTVQTSAANFLAGCGASLGAMTITQVSPTVYDIQTAVNQTVSTTYYLTVRAVSDTIGVIDVNEAKGMTSPYFATFIGQETLKVVSAQASSLSSFIITFSKDVLAGSGTGGSEKTSYYTLPAALGSVTSAQRYDALTGLASDANKVLISHSSNQTVGIYGVVVNTALRNSGDSEALQANPYDRTSFVGFGGNVLTLDDGSLFSDPFGDGTSFAFAFTYRGKVYMGPNNNNTAVFRFDPDGANAATVTFVNSSATNNGTTTFGTNLTRPSTTVSVPAGTTTRYEFPYSTDLSPFVVGNTVQITGCANPNNNKTTTLTAVSNSTTAGTNDYLEVDNAVAGVASTSETCSVFIYRTSGPDNFVGVNAFTSATVNGVEYLAFGGYKISGGGFNEVLLTQDQDAILNNSFCNIAVITLGNTQSLQNIYGSGSKMYVGFASSGTKAPLFGYFDLAGTTCSSVTDMGTNANELQSANYIGTGGANANSFPAGVDSMIVFGTKFIIANNNGIAFTTTIPPTSATNFNANGATGDIMRCDTVGGGICDAAWSTGGTTQSIPNIGKLRPGEKGIPFMVQYGSNLYVARNRSDNNTAELWKFDGTSTWTNVLKTGDTVASSNTVSSNSTDISMVIVNGSRLYVGFDNATEGAEIFYATTTPTGASSFTKLGSQGLGPVTGSASVRAKNKHIISSASIQNPSDGKYYLYLTAGCLSDFSDNGACDRSSNSNETDFSIKVFRQVD